MDDLGRRLRADDPWLADALSDAADKEPGPRAPGWVRRLAVGAAAALSTFLVLVAATVGGPGGAAAVAVTLLLATTCWILVRRRRTR
ncbi:hypothetical protein BJF78_26435 [Pseudonocardia sp. CNS-139]|nr:hypothetical protein BJF78_26435 [Pseudonocardia sp. CNS-139]